jgi:hypothetical protein
MRKYILYISLILISVLISTAYAEQNRYKVADDELRRVYEHFEGISLKDAIDRLIMEKENPGNFMGDVTIHVNSGNYFFTGQNNTIEFSLKSNYPLEAVSLGFEFKCTAGDGYFSWVEDYGTISAVEGTTTGPANILKIHPEAFNQEGKIWATHVKAFSPPDSILISGYRVSYIDSTDVILHSDGSYVVPYSMQIYLKDDSSLVGEKFIINNIFIYPEGEWFFDPIPPDKNFAPAFNWHRNLRRVFPNAPPDTFEIAKIGTDNPGDLKNLNRTSLKNALIISRDMSINFEILPLHYDSNGNEIIGVTLSFSGNMADLEELSVKFRGNYGKYICIQFPLSILPQVCQIEGVNLMHPVQKATLD